MIEHYSTFPWMVTQISITKDGTPISITKKGESKTIIFEINVPKSNK